MKTFNYYKIIFYFLSMCLILNLMSCDCDRSILMTNTWVLTDYGAKNATTPVLDPTTVTFPGSGIITLGFNNNKVNGKDGCNSYFGVFTQSSCSINIDSINNTLILCSPEIMTQANKYMTILREVEKFNTKNEQLKLSTSDNRVLIFRKE